MHVVLGLLGVIVTILVLLNRLAEAGIDLGGLNPFLWSRRRKWKNKYHGNPIYQLDDPMELAGLLMVGIAKIEGDMSKEQKGIILKMFEEEFKLSKRDAVDLLLSCVHLYGKGDEFRGDISKIIKPCREKLTEDQSISILKLLEDIAQLEGNPSDLQNALLSSVKSEIKIENKSNLKWH
jgi:uncharacterized tellurite resistance protein B-like protein